jgi:hypothetical protein
VVAVCALEMAAVEVPLKVVVVEASLKVVVEVVEELGLVLVQVLELLWVHASELL